MASIHLHYSKYVWYTVCVFIWSMGPLSSLWMVNNIRRWVFREVLYTLNQMKNLETYDNKIFKVNRFQMIIIK